MVVVSSHKDVEAMTLTFVAEFQASAERVWQVWEDPRQLERWWGPPTWPATFLRHDFVVGGQSHYFMTGPEGETSHGMWETTAIEKPKQLSFDDAFADENGVALTEPAATRCTVTLVEDGGKTVMTTLSQFDSVEQLDQLVAMGMEEGMRLAMGQLDTVLLEG